MLGDVELQHALITPQGAQQDQASALAGEGAVAAAVQGLAARVERVQAATRAYAHALHLDPTQGVREEEEEGRLGTTRELCSSLHLFHSACGPLLWHSSHQT